MMVTFVSQCEKNALKKTRRVLDAFANRIGDNTWQTLITEDGLLTVKKMLRQTASKSTAVSCHWIRSRSRSQFIWVVGNKSKFNSEGVVAVNATRKELLKDTSFFNSIDQIALFSAIAGLFHDVGKANTLFQNKLNPELTGKFYEPYRHEWVSLRIFQAFVDNKTDKEWLQALIDVDNSVEQEVLGRLISLKIRDGIDKKTSNPFNELPPVARLVAWLIVSHHKLPQYSKGGDNPPSFENISEWMNKCFEACWNSPQCLADDWQQKDIEKNWQFPYGTPLKSAHWQTQISILAKRTLRCEGVFQQSWLEQNFTIHLSRLSLMLSDHYYSSQQETTPQWQDRNYKAYANTDKNSNGQSYLKQKLDEHNIAVGINAYEFAKSLPSLKSDLPTLNVNKALTARVPSNFQADYGWQDSAYNLAKSIKTETNKHGFFGICQSSTGKGKTLGNARIMYGLSEEGECRFSIALGLRILTLQTAEALSDKLNLGKDELALLIGSQAVKDLHEQSKAPKASIQQNQGSESAESLLKDEMALIENLPDYTGECAKWFEHDPKILKLIQTPVLVSTIDYLMPANEGIRGGRQIAPMLRLLTSDLVLDEPDDFGLDDLPALCRLVNWAGMLGSRVLLSTATISPSLASALFSAYQTGRIHYTQVNGELGETNKICCAWFDEFKKPKSMLISNTEAYEKEHSQFIERRIKNLEKNDSALRKGKLIAVERNVEQKASETLASIIHSSIQTLHAQHSIDVLDKKVSIGLVRMANIDPLVQVSKLLLETCTPEDTIIHYCIYHSQFPLLQRSKIESQLDNALSRHNENEWLKQSGIPEVIKKYNEKSHVFVVLATAVAEVGRDHDYDWAIVEPSSMRSIIQLAGRVQRHRKQVPSSENIHILSKNFKGLKGLDKRFEKPGFETEKLKYSSADLTNLVHSNEFNEINAIARIKMPELTSGSITNEKPPRFNSFNLLEHFSQILRLIGNDNETNHAAQWWNNTATWCGEIQRAQPFRQSTPNDDYNLRFNNRTGRYNWQKAISKTSPIEYESTSDIADEPEIINIAVGNCFWGAFNLKEEVEKLANRTGESGASVLTKFTYLSLRQLNTNSAEQWQCHSSLGLYKILKKDAYKND